MNISYQKVINWFKGNLKTLVIVELACLLVATAYFLTAPRIYEANFSIGLPKVPAAVTNNPSGPQIRLLMSPQEFIRPSQDPLGYSDEFMKNCMGEDTNANRKKFINSLQLSVKQQGDVIAFTLRLEGNERSGLCANLLITKVLNDLTVTQDNYLKAAGIATSESANITKPGIIQNIRMSDSYVKPDLIKVITSAVLAGIFLTMFLSVMRKRYSA